MFRCSIAVGQLPTARVRSEGEVPCLLPTARFEFLPTRVSPSLYGRTVGEGRIIAENPSPTNGGICGRANGPLSPTLSPRLVITHIFEGPT